MSPRPASRSAVAARLSRLLPPNLRRTLLSLAEIGNARTPELKLALLPARKRLLVDVGANLGQFARFTAPLYRRVVVFEPIASFADELRAVLPSNCTVQACALADRAGTATFYIPAGENREKVQTASLVAPPAETGHDDVVVDVRRLDDFALEDVAFVKIDVEGAEYDVLLGARDTIARCRPILLVEIEDRHTGGNTRRVFELLRGWGYRAHLQREGGRAPSSPWRNLLRGLAHASGAKRIDLVSVDHRLDEIHAGRGELNAGFGPDYVNNFVFLP